jgi:hypothetical protein
MGLEEAIAFGEVKGKVAIVLEVEGETEISL